MRILEGKGVTTGFGGLAAISNVDFHVDRLALSCCSSEIFLDKLWNVF
jgi:hypothetical protein